ncbi:MAG: type II toxin-antitoxin system VapB family antitoxin [Spirochaetales bacterium]|nr:type II toxin-antitoxin system VapB family antitoxin [Spirochaetales bacterium]
MRTNIVLDDQLMDEAFRYSDNIKTKRELIEIALQEYVKNRKRKDLRDLKGQVLFEEGYDYKAMRAGN